MLETTLSENCQCYFHFFHCSFGSIWKLITVLHCFQIGSPTKQSEHSENSELPDSSKTIKPEESVPPPSVSVNHFVLTPR